MDMGYLWPYGVQGHFGIIRYTCFEMVCNSKTTVRRTKWIEIWIWKSGEVSYIYIYIYNVSWVYVKQEQQIYYAYWKQAILSSDVWSGKGVSHSSTNLCTAHLEIEPPLSCYGHVQIFKMALESECWMRYMVGEQRRRWWKTLMKQGLGRTPIINRNEHILNIKPRADCARLIWWYTWSPEDPIQTV